MSWSSLTCERLFVKPRLRTRRTPSTPANARWLPATLRPTHQSSGPARVHCGERAVARYPTARHSQGLHRSEAAGRAGSAGHELPPAKRKAGGRTQTDRSGGRPAISQIVAQGISAQLLEWKGIEATENLAKSPNAKVVVIGGGKNGLPLILGQ